MSERRKPGDWVVLEGGIPAQIQPEVGDPEPCLKCQDGDCVEWSAVKSRTQTFQNVSECQMATLPSVEDLPDDPADKADDFVKRIEAIQYPTDGLLHRLWTRAVGTPGYDKKEWQALESAIWAGIDAERILAHFEKLPLDNLNGVALGPVLAQTLVALRDDAKGRRRPDLSGVDLTKPGGRKP